MASQFPRVGVEVVAIGVRGYIRDINSASRATDSFGDRIMSTANTMRNVMIGAMSATGVAAGAFLKTGIDEAAEFEFQMDAVQAVLQESDSRMAQLQNTVEQLALDPSLRVDLFEAADAVEVLAKNGVDLATIMNGAAESTIQLANSTGGDFASSADIMTDILNQFNLEVGEMGRAVDGATGVVNSSKFTMNDYALALAQSGAIASQVGVELEDFNTFVAMTASTFRSGSDSGTSFKTFLQRLIPASNQASDAMFRVGLMAEDAEGNVRNLFFTPTGQLKSMAEITDLLNQKLGHLNEQGLNDVLSTIFGTDGFRAAAALLGSTGEEFDAFSAKVNSSGQAAQSAEQRVTNFKSAMEIFQGVLQGARVEIGQIFLPALEESTRSFTVMAESLAGKLIPEIKAFATAVDLAGSPMEALDAVLTLLENRYNLNVGAIRNLIQNGLVVFDEFIKPLVSTLFEWQDVLTAIAVIIGGLVVSALVSLATTLAPLIAIFLAVLGAVRLVRMAWENDFFGIQGITETVVGVITDKWNSLLSWWETNKEPMKVQASDTFNSILEVGSTAMDFLAQGVENFWIIATYFWETYGGTISAFFSFWWTTLVEMVMTNLALISAFWNENSSEIIEFVTRTVKMVLDFFGLLVTGVVTLVTFMWATVTGKWYEASLVIEEAWKTLWVFAEELLNNAVNQIITVLNILGADIETVFDASKWFSMAWEAGQGLYNGLLEWFNSIWAKASEIWNSITGLFGSGDLTSGAVGGGSGGYASVNTPSQQAYSSPSGSITSDNRTYNFNANYSSQPEVGDRSTLARAVAGY